MTNPNHTRRNAAELAEQHNLCREATRHERLRALMISVPFVKAGAQLCAPSKPPRSGRTTYANKTTRRGNSCDEYGLPKSDF